ncbi:MAG: hypothetical protein QM710_08775 [Flavobacterium sp.]
MRNLLLFTLAFIFHRVNSQELKTYEGEYQQGFAKYQYFETKDYERIFNGYFNYKKDNQIFISGNYKDNKKSGEWVYSNKVYKVKGTYIDNKKNGIWTFSEIKSSNEKTTALSLNFRNDTVVGKINLPNLKGEFSKAGKYIGTWTIKKDDTEIIAEFKDNMVIKLVERKISDGSIYTKYIPDLDSIAKAKLALKEADSKYRLDSFSEQSRFLYNEDILGFPIGKNYNMGSFAKFVHGVKSEIVKLDFYYVSDCPVAHNFTLINNPELLLLKDSFRKKEYGSGTASPGKIGYDGYGSGSGSGYGTGSGSGGGYSLGNRKATLKSAPNLICQESGRVAVQISVDRSGNVIKAVAGVQGTTNPASCLIEEAKKAALQTKWQPDNNAPETQIGKIVYVFTQN